MKVRVIGAGFSGLAVAYSLVKKGCDVGLYESSDRAGGLLSSQRHSWGLVESAANGIRASRNVVQLFEDIDLEYQTMKAGTRKRFIFRDKPKQVPLSPLEITRMSAGLFRRPQPRLGQTVESYAESIFGYGAAHYLIEPALFGIFAERASQLSANLIYNYFFKHRSAKSSKARGTLAPTEGMAALVDSLVDYLEKNNCKIHYTTTIELDSLIPTVIATDAHAASELLENVDEWVSDKLKSIEYLPMTSVTIGFKETKRSLNGFGCLFPSEEDFNSLGVLFNNDIFENRGPYQTETWMIRGSEHSDDELRNLIQKDRERMIGVQEEPDEFSIQRWPKALPHYSVQLEKLLEELVLPHNVYLVGNYMGRMGLGKILDQCHEVTDRIVQNES